jgi:hypothetical protein
LQRNENSYTFFKLANVIKENLYKIKPKGLLLDAREHKGLSPEAQKYAVSIIGEYTKLHGKIKEAILMSPDVFSQFSAENYSKKLEEKETPIETKFFDNLKMAEDWLKT